MKMNTERFVSFLILEEWVAYRANGHPKLSCFYHNQRQGLRVYGFSDLVRHGVQPSDNVPGGDFHVVPWHQVSMKELASLRRTMRKEGLL